MVVILSILLFLFSCFEVENIWKDKGCSGTEEDPRCVVSNGASPAFIVDDDGTGYIVHANCYLSVTDVSTGEVKWRTQSEEGVWDWWIPVVAVVRDFQEDGDIVIVTLHVSDKSRVCAWYLDGTKLFCTIIGEEQMRSMSVGKLSGDSYSIVVGKFDSITVLDNEGNELDNFPQSDGIEWIGADNIGLIDLTGDGNLEIVVPSDTNRIAAYDYKGDPVQIGDDVPRNEDGLQGQTWGDEAEGNYVLYYIDGEETKENRLWNDFECHSATPFEHDGKTLVAVSSDCKYFSEWRSKYEGWETLPLIKSDPIRVFYSHTSHVIAADIDNDGNQEMIFSMWDAQMHCFWIDSKSEKHNWPYNMENRIGSEPVVFQVEGEDPVIVFGSWRHQEDGAEDIGKLHFVNYKGDDVISPIDLPELAEGTEQTWSGVKASPTLFRYPDMSDNLYLTLNTVYGGNLLFELKGTEKSRILWKTGRGSWLRNGNKEFEDIDNTFENKEVSGDSIKVKIWNPIFLMILFVGVYILVLSM